MVPGPRGPQPRWGSPGEKEGGQAGYTSGGEPRRWGLGIGWRGRVSDAGSLQEVLGEQGDPAFYLDLFLDEGREGLARLQVWLGTLSGRAEERELVAEAFRTLHSFKGMADTLAFRDLVALAHAMEGLLDGLRWGRGELTAEAQALLLGQVRWLQERLTAIADGAVPQGEAVVAGPVAQLEAILAGFLPPGQGRWEQQAPRPTPPAPAAPSPALPGSPRWVLRFRFEEACTMRSARAMLALASLEALGEVVELAPPLEALDHSTERFSLTLHSAADEATLRQAIAQLSELRLEALIHPPKGPAAPPAPRPALSPSSLTWVEVALKPGIPQRAARAAMCVELLAAKWAVLRTDPDPSVLWTDPKASSFRVLVQGLDDPTWVVERLEQVAEVEAVRCWPEAPAEVAPAGAVPHPEALASSLPKALAEFPPAAPPGPEPPPPPGAPALKAPRRRPRRSIRVDGEALGLLVRRAQALAEALVLAGTGPAQDWAEEADALSKALATLGELSVHQALHGLERSAHELARDLGKRLRVEWQGGELRLPRHVAEELVDLLVHLLRNAIDHGLEGPEEREAVGKDPVGLLRILAEREADGTFALQLSDDGRGLDPHPLWAQAVSQGLLGPEDAEALRELDPFAVLTLPGFTSRGTAGRLSGRGVGLDVVRRRCEDWGGQLLIRSEPGRGSTFRLRLPRT